MDLALLAVTALGMIGVFLMLPRPQVALVRLGALLGVLALAGMFLVLVRSATLADPAGGASIIFYIFAAVMIIAAVGVITQPRPVYAALYFVLVTLAGAGLFVLLLAEFMAVVLIIIYAGAILVTYVFVLMLASQGRRTPEYDKVAAGPLWAVLVSFILLGTILMALFPSSGMEIATVRPGAANVAMAANSPNAHPTETEGATAQPGTPAHADASTAVVPQMTNIQVLGLTLYGEYAYTLELAGVLLTIAMVGAVVMSRKDVDEPHEAGTGELPVE